jgi:hypothetical protein
MEENAAQFIRFKYYAMAKKQYTKLTEDYPSDYRGWLGMAKLIDKENNGVFEPSALRPYLIRAFYCAPLNKREIILEQEADLLKRYGCYLWENRIAEADKACKTANSQLVDTEFTFNLLQKGWSKEKLNTILMIIGAVIFMIISVIYYVAEKEGWYVLAFVSVFALAVGIATATNWKNAAKTYRYASDRIKAIRESAYKSQNDMVQLENDYINWQTAFDTKLAEMKPKLACEGAEEINARFTAFFSKLTL